MKMYVSEIYIMPKGDTPVLMRALLCLILCDPMVYNPPGSFVHGISQARIPEWVPISDSRGTSWQRDWTCVSYVPCIARQIPYHCTTWRRKWQPTPVFLPGKSYGQRNLVGYSSWSHKESDTTEHTHQIKSKKEIQEERSTGVIITT